MTTHRFRFGDSGPKNKPGSVTAKTASDQRTDLRLCVRAPGQEDWSTLNVVSFETYGGLAATLAELERQARRWGATIYAGHDFWIA